MRACTMVSIVCVLSAPALVGCGEREPYNAHDVAAATQFHALERASAMRSAPHGPSEAAKVRCRCDAEGGLHVTAPQDAQVTAPPDASNEDAEAEITMAERPGTPIRRTVSLGFVGDGPLTQTPSRGGPWNVPDALLPPHRHVQPYYGPSRGYASPAYGYRTYGGGPHGGQWHAGAPRGGALPGVSTHSVSTPGAVFGGRSAGGGGGGARRGPR